jgi:hypothetical protein
MLTFASSAVEHAGPSVSLIPDALLGKRVRHTTYSRYIRVKSAGTRK